MADRDAREIQGYTERLRSALMVGMDWDTAVIAINIPTEILAVIEADPEMQTFRERVVAEAELALLNLHQTARKIAASKGQGRPIEWALAQLRPEKYGGNSSTLPSVAFVVKDDI